MNHRRVFLAVVIASALAAYLTIVVGGDLTASQSGFACGESWPLCPGGVIPDLSQPGVAIEFTHRVVAFATSLLILATLILAFLWFRSDRRILWLSVSTMALLVAQVVLGMATVQSDLNPAIVTAHLALGTATFASALVLAVVLALSPPPRPLAGGAPG